jgi:type IV secretion system protein VirB10
MFLLLALPSLKAQQTSTAPGSLTPAPQNSNAPAVAGSPTIGLAGAQSALAGAAPTSTSQVPVAPVDPSLTVPAGTKVLLSLESPINTKTAKPGDGVYLVSTFPVIIGTHVLVPSGVYVQGVVDQVERAGRVKGRAKGRAKLLMHFTTMIFPNGQVVSIPGGVNNLPGSDGATVKNPEGQIEQAGTKGKDAADIAKASAAGVGVGSIAGAAAGHPLEGIGYGAAAGAVGGLVYTMLNRGPDITIAQGASVEMVLQRPLVLEPAQLAGINDTSGAPQYRPSAQQQQPLPKPRNIICPPGSLGCT